MTGRGAFFPALRGAVRLAAVAAPAHLACSVALVAAAGLSPLAVAWCTKAIVDVLAAAGADGATVQAGRLVWVAVALAGTGVVAAIVPFARDYADAELGRRVGLVAQDRLYAAVGRWQGLARFENPRFLHRLSVARQVGGSVPADIVAGGLQVGQALVTTVGFLVSMLIADGWLLVFMIGASVPAFVAELRLARDYADSMYRAGAFARREFLWATLITDLRAAKEVRMFGSGPWLRARAAADRRSVDAINRRIDRRRLGMQGGLALVSALTTAVGLVWAVGAAASGRLTVGDVALFLAAAAGVQSGLSGAARATAAVRQQGLLFGHYHAVESAPPDLPVPGAPRPLPPLRSGIELRDVWYRYGDDQPWVLRGVDLVIPFGATLGVVGANGAGKSTLIRLLCRFADPQRGAILWDGVDLRDVSTVDLRARMTVLFQDFMQYDLTAAENIALGDPALGADRARIEAAAGGAGVHDVVAALPRGYETMLSRSFLGGEMDDGEQDDGVVLSGGQWQRLALARALLRQRRDLAILDEPSASLDGAGDDEVSRAVGSGAFARTTLVTTHRLGGLRHADLVAVMHEGAVVEQGNHAELIAAGGRYAEMFDLQAGGFRAGGAVR